MRYIVLVYSEFKMLIFNLICNFHLKIEPFYALELVLSVSNILGSVLFDCSYLDMFYIRFDSENQIILPINYSGGKNFIKVES